jgi:hypothetical protein
VRSRSSPFPRSRRPALTCAGGHGPDTWGANRCRTARAELSSLRLRRYGPRNRSPNRGHMGSEGSREARLDLEGFRPRRRDNSRRLRGNDRRSRRNHGRRLLAGRRRSDRQNLVAGQEEERIQVPIRVGAPPHAEMDVGHRELHHAARTDGPNDVALRQARAATHGDRAEMQERDRVTILGLDGDRPAAHRHGPGEGDHPGRRREHGRSRRGADVDPAVLARRIRIVAEQEGPQHRPLHRPGPTQSGRRHGERSRNRSANEQSEHHRAPPLLSDMKTRPKGSRAGAPLSNLITETCGRAGCAPLP